MWLIRLTLKKKHSNFVTLFCSWYFSALHGFKVRGSKRQANSQHCSPIAHIKRTNLQVRLQMVDTLFIPISRPTDATCDRFLFYIYMCITLHVSSVKRSSSGVPHRTYSLQFLCLCLSATLSCRKKPVSYKTVLQTDTNTGNCRLYVRWGTPDYERLTFETCRVIHI
jgi:hypothetical protein